MGAERKWMFSLFTVAFITFLVFLSLVSGFCSYKNSFLRHKSFSMVHHGPGHPPAFAYYISGGKGDAERIFRLLLAVYHPRNRYLLHISADEGDKERESLGSLVNSMPVIRAFQNVDVIGVADANTYIGSTNIAATLRAIAILLKMDTRWDWFVTLSAADYPLITQDDLSHAFASVRRDLNFIDHTSDLGWKEGQRIEPIVVDPGIYLARKNHIFHATQKRPIPDAFIVFTGSPWVILSRSFLEFCVLGWDNLPRTLLMYSTNVVLPQEVYFQSVICNSPEFRNLTVNADLRYFLWDDPPKMEPRFLDSSNYDKIVNSGAAFARQFRKDEPVLDIIDEKILMRGHNSATPGGWCRGINSWFMDPCSQWGNLDVLKLGPQAQILADSVQKLVDDSSSKLNTCA